MLSFRIHPDKITAQYEVLNTIGALGKSPADGYLRAAYSPEETQAMSHIERSARTGGLSSRWDAAGNLIVELPGETDQWVETGSHLDTVPYGGNFDGAAGVVAGLAAMFHLKAKAPRPHRGLRLRVWRGEESATFQEACLGSKAAFGVLNPASLENRYEGVSLKQAMVSQGVDPALILTETPALSQEEIDGITAHVELHIEQGNMLEKTGNEIGIVTGIRGAYRQWVTLEGQFDHSGATPMGSDFRKDVNLALAAILLRLDDLARESFPRENDLVQTVGVINSSRDRNDRFPGVYRNAVTKVSGYGYFSHEVRSCDTEFRDRYCSKAQDVITETALSYGVKPQIEVFADNPGIQNLNTDIQNVVAAACEGLRYSYTHIPSGAWHDAAVVAQQPQSSMRAVPVGMIFIPCRNGRSHCPEECTSPYQIAAGASVLAGTLWDLAHRLR